MSAVVLAPVADNEAARWQQWRHHYEASSRANTTQMHLLFGGALMITLGFLVRALLA